MTGTSIIACVTIISILRIYNTRLVLLNFYFPSILHLWCPKVTIRLVYSFNPRLFLSLSFEGPTPIIPGK